MNGAESLLGCSYEELKAAPALRGIDLPEPEHIEDISYLSFMSSGLSLVLPEFERVTTVQLHSAGHEGFAEYPGSLPGGLRFGMSRDEVRRQLGPPVRQGEEGAMSVLGKRPAWDLFATAGLNIHLEYKFGSKGIRMVSLTRDTHR